MALKEKWAILNNYPEIEILDMRGPLHKEKGIYLYRKGTSYGLISQNALITDDRFLDAFSLISNGIYNCAAAQEYKFCPFHNNIILLDVETGTTLIYYFAAYKIHGQYFCYRIDGANDSHSWGIYNMKARRTFRRPNLSIDELNNLLKNLKS